MVPKLLQGKKLGERYELIAVRVDDYAHKHTHKSDQDYNGPLSPFWPVTRVFEAAFIEINDVRALFGL